MIKQDGESRIKDSSKNKQRASHIPLALALEQNVFSWNPSYPDLFNNPTKFISILVIITRCKPGLVPPG